MVKSFDDNIGWDLSKDMQAICKPLKHSLNIDYITYARYFNNGRYSILFTDGNTVSNCFKHPDHQLPGFVLNSGIYHWQDLYSPALLTDLCDAFGHNHGVTFIREYDHFTVAWHLGNVKQKLGVTEKRQLFELAKKNYLHW